MLGALAAMAVLSAINQVSTPEDGMQLAAWVTKKKKKGVGGGRADDNALKRLHTQVSYIAAPYTVPLSESFCPSGGQLGCGGGERVGEEGGSTTG